MFDYRVTIMIENGEELDFTEYWVEANSFEEAVENVKSELGID